MNRRSYALTSPQAYDLSKADWMDAYADLYRQTHGESADEACILADARERLALVKLANKGTAR